MSREGLEWKAGDIYGISRGRIVYDDESGEFSDFPETSIFYDMGYTVSQFVGLTADERQSILEHAIKSGKASQYQVLSYLKKTDVYQWYERWK